MLDNQLIQVFLPIVNAGLTAYGFSGVNVVQANQPTQQGAYTSPTVYFFKVSDKRYGFLNRTSEYDQINQIMVHTESQDYETTFQFMAWAIQDPSNVNSVTASDLVNTVAAIMQSDSTINTLNSNNVGVLRITDIRNPYFSDDMDRFEASPSFDIIFTHQQINIITIPATFTIIPTFARI